MPSPLTSPMYRDLFGDAEVAALFAGSAEVRAMLLVEGTLALVQGRLGLIPAASGDFLHRACLELPVDPAGLAAQTGIDGVPVPALLAAFRKVANAPDHTQWLHWGATSQDIVDTALALRLKRILAIFDTRLTAVVTGLGTVTDTYAGLPMAGRTYGQVATPTTFGALAKAWGHPLSRWHQRLAPVQADVARVSLSGAAGTLAAMGPQGPVVRAALAEALALGDPGGSWHTERDGIASLAAWMTGVCTSLGKMGEDLLLLSQSGIAEVNIAGSGGSSTMPQKQNPVGSSVLVALARTAVALNGALQGAAIHRQQRDGTAWFTEWLTLPQLCLVTGRALTLAAEIVARLEPDPVAMQRGLAAGGGVIYAEALVFALVERGGLSRPDAQAAVKALCGDVITTGRRLLDLAAERFPGTDWAAEVGARGPAAPGPVSPGPVSGTAGA